jgi:hypothetical protein
MSRFMHQVARQFSEHAISETDYVFLLAPLVPARASAMVRARPDSATVDIDALWGFPDGLLMLPHDSYVVTHDEEKATVRQKPACLLWSSGAWRITVVGADFDWRMVLARGELRQLATWGRELACREGREVQLLALARIGGARGPAACLPFHYTTFDAARARSRTLVPRSRLHVVRAPADLRALRRRSAARGILLRPDVRHLRDVPFLRAVGEAAAAAGLPILFEGSLIGHAYYVLTTTGAVVIPSESAGVPDRGQTGAFIVAPRGGIARVRAVELQHLRRAAQEHEAADAAPGLPGRRRSTTRSPLADLLDKVDTFGAPAADYGGVPFAHLPRVEGRAARAVGDLLTDAPGDAPLFMDRL